MSGQSSVFQKVYFWCKQKQKSQNKWVTDFTHSSDPVADLKNPKQNKKTAGFTTQEREGFSKLLDSGFIDSFRTLYPDKEEVYTFWSNFRQARERNIGW